LVFFRDGVISLVSNSLTFEGHVLVVNAFRHPALPITLLHHLLSLRSSSGLVSTNFTKNLTLPANAMRRLKVGALWVETVYCSFLALKPWKVLWCLENRMGTFLGYLVFVLLFLSVSFYYFFYFNFVDLFLDFLEHFFENLFSFLNFILILISFKDQNSNSEPWA
jgi:hypothetical protein